MRNRLDDRQQVVAPMLDFANQILLDFLGAFAFEIVGRLAR
jgi:hypothetical protein